MSIKHEKKECRIVDPWETTFTFNKEIVLVEWKPALCWFFIYSSAKYQVKHKIFQSFYPYFVDCFTVYFHFLLKPTFADSKSTKVQSCRISSIQFVLRILLWNLKFVCQAQFNFPFALCFFQTTSVLPSKMLKQIEDYWLPYWATEKVKTN
jgi:hypothetical protein